MSPDLASATAAVGTPRGFIPSRTDGRVPLPGSLHHNRRLAHWFDLSQPGTVQVLTGKVELGQGILTALQLIAAEELDLPLESVRVRAASTAHGPDEGVTSGSLSVQDSGSGLRQACAELRALAVARAAQRAGVGPEAIAVVDGRFIVGGAHDMGGYHALLHATDLQGECTGQPAPKTPQQRRWLGRTTAPRLDLADKVMGRPRFIHDLRPPGLRHGRVLRAARLGAELSEASRALVRDLASGAGGAQGLGSDLKVVVDGRFVAVVGLREREVEAAAERLRTRLSWQPVPPLPAAAQLADDLQRAPCDTTVVAERGQPWAQARGRTFSATYFKPYLAHASIAPSCALAHWDGQRLEVWTHSQGIHNLRDDLVRALSRPGDAQPVAAEAITVHHVEGAGCYGHNGADDVAMDAVLLAWHLPGAPVRVQWSRADELSHSPFGPAQRVMLQAAVDEAGRLTHWQHTVWANGFSSRPGRATVPSLLAASERAGGAALPLPVNPPLSAGGGADRNAVPAYTVPNLCVINHRLTVMPLRTSAMRALGAFANVMAIESFMDEIALALQADPVAFRRAHLDDARALAVLDTVVQRCAWWGRDAAVAAGVAQGQGLGLARYKNTGAWCAALARVQVSDHVRVLDLELVVDVGAVVDLDGVINQIEGGAVQATSWTLKEQVRYDDGGVTSTGWDTYPVLRFREVPSVVVHVLDRPTQPSLGAGEAAQGPVAAAIANAVARALGVRVRSLPLSPEALLQAVHASEA